MSTSRSDLVELLKRHLDDSRPMPANKPSLEYLRERRAIVAGIVGELETRARQATASEARSIRAHTDAADSFFAAIDERIEDLEQREAREDLVAAHRRELGITEPDQRWTVSEDVRGGVYRDPHKDPTSPSFFKDMYAAKRGDWAAAERLDRSHKAAIERENRAAGIENRAGDLTTSAGHAGEFAPPLWLVNEFVALARPGRVTADLCRTEPLPSGVSSINLPKVASGATTGVQATQNSALSDTAMTTTSVSSGITTVGGKQILSLQLVNQSPVSIDRVILQDLAADYAKAVDQQVLYGANGSGEVNGLVNVAAVTTFTSASPALTSATAANSFYNKVLAAASGIATARYMPAEAIVMHPSRWFWCLEALDGEVRPIIDASGRPMNSVGVSTDVRAEGSVGTMGNLPVFIDPNISLAANGTSGTQAQDEVYVLRSSDVYLYESNLRLEAFDATYADQASLLVRALGWISFIPNRYSASTAVIRGTGLLKAVL